MSMDLLDRLIEHTEFSEEPDGCWLWDRSVGSHGYGQTWIPDGDPILENEDHGARVVLVHRVAFERLVAPLPRGFELQIDHLCRVKRCWNPDHIELVTAGENNRRRINKPNGNTGKTHCDHGHPLDEANTYTSINHPGHRWCRTCRNEASRRHRAKKNGVVTPMTTTNHRGGRHAG